MDSSGQKLLIVTLVLAAFAATLLANFSLACPADKKAMQLYKKLHNETGEMLNLEEVKKDLKQFTDLCKQPRYKCHSVYSVVEAELKASSIEDIKCYVSYFDERDQIALRNERYYATMMPYLDHYYRKQLKYCENSTIKFFLETMDRVPAQFQGVVTRLVDKVIEASPSDKRRPVDMTMSTVNQETLGAALEAFSKEQPELPFAIDLTWSKVDDSIVKACQEFNQRYSKFAGVFRRCSSSEECLSGLTKPGVVRRLNQFRVCRQLVDAVDELVNTKPTGISALLAKVPRCLTACGHRSNNGI